MSDKVKLEQDEVESYSDNESVPNPPSGDFDISLSIPESIKIRMVDASSLNISSYKRFY